MTYTLTIFIFIICLNLYWYRLVLRAVRKLVSALLKGEKAVVDDDIENEGNFNKNMTEDVY